MSSGMGAFDLLHPQIQEQLYQMRWETLRPIQVDAIRSLILTESNVLISAQTASGKTEAAFLPILSQLADAPYGGVKALYVSPLKALINDQFRRLEELCNRTGIPVFRWHGDVGQSSRKELLERPGGVLLITPESIEALIVNRPHALASLFGQLRFIVVDELHSFIGSERGAHLRSLICRLIGHSREKVRLVALSATMGDPPAAARWLVPHSDSEFVTVSSPSDKTVRYQVKGYVRSKTLASSGSVGVDAIDDDDLQPPVSGDDMRLAHDLFQAFSPKTALVFANSRSKLEFYADLARQQSDAAGLPNRFRVHHGSLSKSEREDTEEALRSDQPTTTFCSSTLELGIDVGNVTEVGQIGPPWSVSSLAQRLGRSGRREGEASVLRLYLEEDEADPNRGLPQRLYIHLLQAIAMTELMLEKWCEPPEASLLHLSTLVQQVLSVIAETGGSSATRLLDVLIRRGGFAAISPSTLAAVLRSMAAHDLVEQTPEGDLILGLRGERLVRSFDFYSAFDTDIELSVIHAGRCIGTITALPGVAAEGFIILAGRRWKVVRFDEEAKQIIVEPSRGGRVPYFAGSGGADVHPVVRAKMREVLFAEKQYSYLDRTAKEMLKDARRVASDAGLTSRQFIRDGGILYWFTWTGTKVNRTLFALGLFKLGLRVKDEGIALSFEGSDEQRIAAAYRGLLVDLPTAEELALSFPSITGAKYHWALTQDLKAADFARSALDVSGARQLLSSELTPSDLDGR